MTTTTDDFMDDLSEMLRPDDPEDDPEAAEYRAWVDSELYWQQRQLSGGWPV